MLFFLTFYGNDKCKKKYTNYQFMSIVTVKNVPKYTIMGIKLTILITTFQISMIFYYFHYLLTLINAALFDYNHHPPSQIDPKLRVSGLIMVRP